MGRVSVCLIRIDITSNYLFSHHELSINNRIMSAKFRLPAIERI